MRPRGTRRGTGCPPPSPAPFLTNRLGMIGSYSFNPQLNPQKLLHCCVHPHGGRSAQRSESHPLKTHRTVHPRTPTETVACPPAFICLDTYMLCRVYQENGIGIRYHCGAEPPRDI